MFLFHMTQSASGLIGWKQHMRSDLNALVKEKGVSINGNKFFLFSFCLFNSLNVGVIIYKV